MGSKTNKGSLIHFHRQFSLLNYFSCIQTAQHFEFDPRESSITEKYTQQTLPYKVYPRVYFVSAVRTPNLGIPYSSLIIPQRLLVLQLTNKFIKRVGLKLTQATTALYRLSFNWKEPTSGIEVAFQDGYCILSINNRCFKFGPAGHGIYLFLVFIYLPLLVSGNWLYIEQIRRLSLSLFKHTKQPNLYYFIISFLRTFARNFSNIDFFLKISPLKDHELAMSEM